MTAVDILFTQKANMGWVAGTAYITGWPILGILIIMTICSLPFVRRGGHFEVSSFLLKLNFIYFTTIDKQVLQLASLFLVGTGVSAIGSMMFEEAGVSGENPTCPSGRPPFPITYNHCRLWESNTGRSG